VLSSDSHRQASNGLLLFNHYQDGDNLYYTGLRVDGNAVIKKKIGGVYYTMAIQPVLAGTYHRDTAPNLIPLNTWIGVRSVVRSNLDHSVDIAVYLDIGGTGQWSLAVEASDSGAAYGAAPFDQEGYVGIRTDFMDVQFRDFAVAEFRE
jgi:hypothetical protein